MDKMGSALIVPFLKGIAQNSEFSEINARMDALKKQPVSELSWPEFSYKPRVEFVLAYIHRALLLKFFVAEQSLRVQHDRDNTAVYEDSCVEFFIAFDGEPSYYNLEFNAKGTCLAQFGKNKNDREFLPPKDLQKIR